jgi:hypothetical protein
MPGNNHQNNKISEDSNGKNPSQRGEKSKKLEYVGAIAGNLVLLYIVNHLMKWHVSFITEDFYKVLPYMNWSIGASIVVNILYIFFDQKFIHRCIFRIELLLSCELFESFHNIDSRFLWFFLLRLFVQLEYYFRFLYRLFHKFDESRFLH